jgi:hypothetical protein
VRIGRLDGAVGRALLEFRDDAEVSPPRGGQSPGLALGCPEQPTLPRAVAIGLIWHCEERAAGAQQAGDRPWVKRQRACAARYAARLAGLYRAQIPLRRSMVRHAPDLGLRNRRTSRADAIAALSRLTDRQRTAMTDAGLPADTLAVAQMLTPAMGAKLKIPDRLYKALGGRTVVQALRRAGNGFDGVAAGYEERVR